MASLGFLVHKSVDFSGHTGVPLIHNIILCYTMALLSIHFMYVYIVYSEGAGHGYSISSLWTLHHAKITSEYAAIFEHGYAFLHYMTL